MQTGTYQDGKQEWDAYDGAGRMEAAIATVAEYADEPGMLVDPQAAIDAATLLAFHVHRRNWADAYATLVDLEAAIGA